MFPDMIIVMETTSTTNARTLRRQLMARRNEALSARDFATFNELTKQIAALPLTGVAELTAKDINKYVNRKQK